jgi:integrative and conjugative element protein (TIGR02256 family)
VFPRSWSSSSGRFRVELLTEACEHIEALANRSHPNETGGILVGHYADGHRLAVVVEASSPPEDSRAGRRWFQRGGRGLVRWLEELWVARTRRYYLGEWHYHPAADVTPSGDDILQMRAIAGAREYKCPEPILVIVGDDRGGARPAWVVVVPLNASEEHLKPAVTQSQSEP